ncbi:MAG: c-type cytochrome [Chitinophagales bacterium]|nr:c-type cytochrome [Chitinophagales bacterium]MDW8272631.1 c-type cytochrome [Chitinophagales bacterium]
MIRVGQKNYIISFGNYRSGIIFAQQNFDNSMTISCGRPDIGRLAVYRISLKVLIFFLLFFQFISPAIVAQDAAAIAEGKALFKANCASCHNPLQNATGPALKGSLARWEAAGEYKGKTGKQWLYEWIRNWNNPVKAGYPYAVQMSNWAASQMNLFPAFKDEEIEKILLYVDNSEVKAAGAPVAAGQPTSSTPENAKPSSDAPSIAVYLFVAFLVILVAILVSVTKRLDKLVAQQKGEAIPVTPSVPFWKSRKLIALLVIIGIIFVGYNLVDGAIHLGRQQGYQPTQPIKFSHQLHSGKHKIECQYCHSTAAVGKHSNIPSVNTCMNCHKNIKQGPEYGKEEIAKIYEAAGWDPDQGKYVREPKPIEWVRIHNLPDHVYFNHAQHVNAGKIACQTCHGPVEEMKEVYQYSPLSMGWCVNCHRQSEVQFASNNYYSTYEKIHEELKNKKIDKVTVERIGGTECQKCHY